MNRVCKLPQLNKHEQNLHASYIQPLKSNFAWREKLLFVIALIGLLATSFTVSGESFIITNKHLEGRYWEFLKERMFDGKSPYVYTFKDDIYINLESATKQDSLIVKDLCKELNAILPNRKIQFSGDRLIRETSVILMFNKNIISYSKYFFRSYAENNGYQLQQWGNKEYYRHISVQYNYLKFNDTTSFNERKRSIEYAVVRSLCHFKGNPENAHVFIKGSILSDFEFNPKDTHLADVDKFLLSKIYSNNFNKEFRSYMVNRYSWIKYLNFINKDLMTTRINILSYILVLIILIVSYHKILNRKYKINYFSYLIPGLLIINAYLLIFIISSKLNGYQYNYQIVLSNLIIVAMSTVLYFIEKFFIKPDMKFSVQLVLKVLFLLTVSLVTFLLVNSREFFDEIILGVVLALGRGMHLYVKGVNESIILKKDFELSKLKELNALAEIKSLHARINPHFLYNSLNSIAGLVHNNPMNAEKMALSLSDMFRYTINRSGEQFSSVKDEVEMVRTYMEIEQIRFGNRMTFSINLEKDCESEQIPKFILQPLVENAIKHGLSKIEANGELKLDIHKTGEKLSITVSDNGPAFPEGLVCGYGLQSLYDLLKLTYGENAEVNWQNEPQKMITVIIKTNARIN